MRALEDHVRVPALRGFLRGFDAVFLHRLRGAHQQASHLSRMRGDREEFCSALAQRVGAPCERVQAIRIQHHGQFGLRNDFADEVLRLRVPPETRSEGEHGLPFFDLRESVTREILRRNRARFSCGQRFGHVFGMSGGDHGKHDLGRCDRDQTRSAT